jgi:hypothetical protein
VPLLEGDGSGGGTDIDMHELHDDDNVGGGRRA